MKKEEYVKLITRHNEQFNLVNGQGITFSRFIDGKVCYLQFYKHEWKPNEEGARIFTFGDFNNFLNTTLKSIKKKIYPVIVWDNLFIQFGMLPTKNGYFPKKDENIQNIEKSGLSLKLKKNKNSSDKSSEDSENFKEKSNSLKLGFKLEKSSKKKKSSKFNSSLKLEKQPKKHHCSIKLKLKKSKKK